MTDYTAVVRLDRSTRNQVIYTEDLTEGGEPAIFLMYLHKGFVRAAGKDIIGWEVTLSPIRDVREQSSEDPEQQA